MDTLLAGPRSCGEDVLHVGKEAQELHFEVPGGGGAAGDRHRPQRSLRCREIGVGEQLLGRWVAQHRARDDHPPPALDVDEWAELERLRVEVAELRMDRAFLKKATAFFVTENQNR